MLDLLQRYRDETGISLLAYCLMENHIHLLLHDEKGITPVFMKKLGVSYARYYNTKYERIGHLFQDRYKSEPVRDESYLLTVFRYILNNPSKAGICSAETYPWSSYGEYGKTGGLTDTEMLCSLIGNDDDFLRFLKKEDIVECMEGETMKKDDAWAMTVILKQLKLESGTQLQQFDKASRDSALALLKEYGVTIRQIERLTGINRGVILKAKVSPTVPTDNPIRQIERLTGINRGVILKAKSVTETVGPNGTDKVVTENRPH